jgi:hypothetical protein
MLADAADLPEGARRAVKAGRKSGWGPLARGAFVAYQTVPQGVKSKQLTVGGVVLNDRESSMVTVQPYRGKWGRVRIIHVPQYQTRNGYCDSPGKPAHEVIPYAALVLQVELLKGGELMHGSSRSLESGGWGL